MRDPFYHPLSTSGLALLEVPEFVGDSCSTPSSSTSLTTPTHPQFVFPPVQDFFQPFPSEERNWFQSIADSIQTPFPDTNPCFDMPHYQPTWHTGPASDYASQMLNELDDSAWTNVQQATGCDPEVNSFSLRSENGEFHQMLKGKAEATGPTRGKKTRKRQAPYKADKGHEGANNKNHTSQQGFQSKTPGSGKVGNDDEKTPRMTREKKNKKKANVDPSATAPPKPKDERMSTIRSHARRNPGVIIFVEGRGRPKVL